MKAATKRAYSAVMIFTILITSAVRVSAPFRRKNETLLRETSDTTSSFIFPEIFLYIREFFMLPPLILPAPPPGFCTIILYCITNTPCCKESTPQKNAKKSANNAEKTHGWVFHPCAGLSVPFSRERRNCVPYTSYRNPKAGIFREAASAYPGRSRGCRFRP